MNKQWQYISENGDQAVSLISDDSVVFYIDDLNKEVVADIVKLWNSGADVNTIQKTLDKDPRVTLDESDYVVEQIENWIQLNPPVEGDQIAANVQIGVDTMTPNEVANTLTTIAEQITNKQTDMIEDTTQIAERQQLIDSVTKPLSLSADGKKSRTPRTTTVRSTGKVDTKDLVAAMKEKITLIEYVDNAIADIELPEALSKSAREILIQMQKAIDTAKGEAIQSIQAL